MNQERLLKDAKQYISVGGCSTCHGVVLSKSNEEEMKIAHDGPSIPVERKDATVAKTVRPKGLSIFSDIAVPPFMTPCVRHEGLTGKAGRPKESPVVTPCVSFEHCKANPLVCYPRHCVVFTEPGRRYITDDATGRRIDVYPCVSSDGRLDEYHVLIHGGSCNVRTTRSGEDDCEKRVFLTPVEGARVATPIPRIDPHCAFWKMV
jgi:hypothetical protein